MTIVEDSRVEATSPRQAVKTDRERQMSAVAGHPEPHLKGWSACRNQRSDTDLEGNRAACAVAFWPLVCRDSPLGPLWVLLQIPVV